MMPTLDNTKEHPYDRHVGRYGQQLAAGLIDFAGVPFRLASAFA
jgi:hypothetical protein